MIKFLLGLCRTLEINIVYSRKAKLLGECSTLVYLRGSVSVLQREKLRDVTRGSLLKLWQFQQCPATHSEAGRRRTSVGGPLPGGEPHGKATDASGQQLHPLASYSPAHMPTPEVLLS